MTGFSEILKGIGGGYEINRVVGAFLALCYGFGAIGFTAWNMIEGREFDVVAFCTAFSGGAALIVGGTAGAVAVKDRNVATATVIAATGSKPATPPAPAPEVKPEIVAATVTSDELPDYAR